MVLLSFVETIGQSGISGQLQDENDQAVPFALVALYTFDTVLVKAEQSDVNGNFEFVNINEGKYFINIRYVGYEAKTITIPNFEKGAYLQLGVQKLQTSVTQLEDVLIESERPLIEVLPGKTIFNVDSDPSNLGNDGITLLSRAPGITIDPDNNIVFQGRTGVRVFINGRPSRLSGADLAAMLMGLQADNIESIELITNPSANYEAEGNTGIIDIKLKRSSDAGINGTFYSNASQGTFAKFNSGINLNYRKDKVNFYGSYTFTNNNTQDEYNHYALQNGYRIDLANPARNGLNSNNITFGTDYYLSKKHFLGFRYTGDFADRVVDGNSETLISTNISDSLEEIMLSKNIQGFTSDNQQFNLNYEFRPNDKTTINTDFNYGTFANEGSTRQPNTYFNPITDLVNRVVDFSDERNTNIDIKVGKIDFEKDFDSFSFSTGAKASLINTDNRYKFYNIDSGEAVLDLNRSNNFTYREDVFAGYAIFSSSIGENWKYDLGLRYEHTISEGILISEIPSNDSKVLRDYGNFFPNIGLTYTSTNKNLLLALSYGKRVARPNYQNLNPFEYKLSELQFMKGNPFLLPSFTDQVQFSYSLKQTLTGNITYSYEKDYVAQVLQIAEDRSSFLQPQNMQDINSLSTTMSFPVKPLDWWEIRTSASYNFSKYYGNFNDTEVDIEAHIYSFNINNNLSITKRFRANLNYSYNGPSIWRGSIFIDPYQSLNLGLSHYFFDNSLQIRVNANDIFNTASDFGYTGDYGGLYMNGAWSGDFNRYGAGLTWNFGNQKIQAARRRKTAIDDEMDRID